MKIIIKMVEMNPEEIPMIPTGEDDGDGDGDDYHNRDEETEFGEHGARKNDGFDPDDYRNDRERSNAKKAMLRLQELGLETRRGLRYALYNKIPSVTEFEEDRGWYKVKKVGNGYVLDPIDRNEGHASSKVYELLGLDSGGHSVTDTSTLTLREENRDEAWDKIISKFPKFNPKTSPFTAKLGDYGEVVVKLNRLTGKYHRLFGADGELNEKLPKTIKNSLGRPAEKVIKDNELAKEKIKEEIENLKEQRIEASEPEKEIIDKEIKERETRYNEIEQENEIIEERMSLKDRAKAMFKKYGLTITGVLAGTGVVIASIVAPILSSLKTGLTNTAKGIGNGLKDLGKKLAGILPGMVGAIVSFLFKAAGEAIGFLAKHTWLLILLVVTFVIEQFKNKKKKS